MIDGRLRVGLSRVVRGLIWARTGDAVFVAPGLRIVPARTTAYTRARDVSPYDVEPAASLLVSVEEESDQRP